MSEPFIAEIRIFAGTFAIRGWAFCDGQLLPIQQNTALFSVVGTTYGGDGRTTFGLPNLRGRAPMHPGNGPGLSSRRVGEALGEESVSLTEAQMPNHSHALRAANSPFGALQSPAADRTFNRSGGANAYQSSSADPVPLAEEALAPLGGSQAHNNMQPYLVLNFIIALQGIFPSRS
jgi:microcystin-dependent protein